MAGRFRQARCACRTSAETLAARQPMMPEQVNAGMAEVWASDGNRGGLAPAPGLSDEERAGSKCAFGPLSEFATPTEYEVRHR